jgi:hypothetical protein
VKGYDGIAAGFAGSSSQGVAFDPLAAIDQRGFGGFGDVVCFYFLIFLLRKIVAIPDVDTPDNRAVSAKDSPNCSVIFCASPAAHLEHPAICCLR